MLRSNYIYIYIKNERYMRCNILVVSLMDLKDVPYLLSIRFLDYSMSMYVLFSLFIID